MHDSLQTSTPALHKNMEDPAQYLRDLLDSMAPNTRSAYSGQLRSFASWCKASCRSPLPASPGTVAAYIHSLRDSSRSMSTIQQALAAISRLHAACGFPPPSASEEVRAAMAASSRLLGRKSKKKAALTAGPVSLILSYIPQDRLIDLRDRALISVGFCGAFRRSELASLRMDDLETAPPGPDGRKRVFIHVRRSKTDQTGKGMTKCIFSGSTAVDPVKELGAWIRAAGLSGTGCLFPGFRKGDSMQHSPISPGSIARMLKARASAAGLDPSDISGHSLRRGFITSAVRAGASERSIMNQTGHRRTEALREYYERRDAAEDNAASLI